MAEHTKILEFLSLRGHGQNYLVMKVRRRVPVNGIFFEAIGDQSMHIRQAERICEGIYRINGRICIDTACRRPDRD